ncbi:MAG: hypothetical protein NZ821_02275, partial [Gloeomargarita sp. SKYB31]|nr:hypothetical protein [Gloeomargarita sp. SKYB31]
MGPSIVPGNRPLSSWQQRALAWVGRWGGRDVVLAVDLTESVGLNDAGRLHLRQIVEKTLDKGHNLHVIPFATSVHSPQVFHYQGPEDIPKILAAVPMSPGPEQGTDIKCAELAIYRYLAELNQQRLQQGQPIKAQSVVWVTDAPLHLPQGKEWVEAPNSPCGLADQPLAAERDRWLAVLPMSLRQMPVGQFQLSVVDIAPTVQEFCTPKPGGGEVCPVNSYLWGQLWWQLLLGGILCLAAGVGGVWSLVRWVRQQIPWPITIQVNDQEYPFKLRHGQKIDL